MIDWMRLCGALRGLFGSLNQVARLIHYGNPEYIGKLERGEIADPRYSLGANLIELHQKHLGDVPMCGIAQQRKLI